jgi:hypothetical protein
MNNTGWVFISVALLLFACGTGQLKESAQNAKETTAENNTVDGLVGKWVNSEIKVVANRTDPDEKKWEVVVECHEGNWEEVTNMKPIITEFRADSSWESVYRNLNDSIFRIVSGNWYTVNDSLFMEQTAPDSSVNSTYHYEFEENTALFKGFLDWDQDGKPDDLYEGMQKRLADQN